MTTIVFSHGFGTDKHSRGLFDVLAENLGPDNEYVMFDYNKVDKVKNTLTVEPFSLQADKLVKATADMANYVLICHSQGGLIAALAKPAGARKIIMLAPPLEMSSARLIKKYAKRPGSVMNINGTSKLVRRDGSITLIDKKYWIELDATDPTTLYQQLAKTTPLIIIGAEDDEVLPDNNYEPLKLSNIDLYTLPANHDFTGTIRDQLSTIIKSEL